MRIQQPKLWRSAIETHVSIVTHDIVLAYRNGDWAKTIHPRVGAEGESVANEGFCYILPVNNDLSVLCGHNVSANRNHSFHNLVILSAQHNEIIAGNGVVAVKSLVSDESISCQKRIFHCRGVEFQCPKAREKKERSENCVDA